MQRDIQKRIEQWLKGPYDVKTKEEINRLQTQDPTKLSDAFFKDLSFGTGGMRGLMGVGTNRMNIYTVRRATQGLANYIIKESKKTASVFIGYDVRHHSKEFAMEAACVLAANGIKVLLAKEVCPTPLVSFACRHYHCQAAIMITASHNPPEYNGYKVYWSDGAQLVSPHDEAMMAEVKKVEISQLAEINSPLISWVGEEIDTIYLEKLSSLQMHPELAKVPLSVIYSNLHGTGIRLVPKALQQWGYHSVALVEKQKSLDGGFPFAQRPNPEEEAALELGTEQLLQTKSDLYIATDPDGDRMGIVIRDQGKPYRLSGNQIACLCLHHICTSLKEKKRFPKQATFIKTIVTTELFKAIAEGFGGVCVDVLTGFKYIAEKIRLWENSPTHYVFGAEESYGYLFGTFVRDKDAISSSCLIVEAAAAAKKEGMTLIEKLHQIYRQYGIHRESLTNLSFGDSQKGMQEMETLMQNLRESPPERVGGTRVIKVEDYLKQSALPLSNVLRFWLEDKTKIVIRPSGTEPKVKIYVEVVEETFQDIQKGILKSDERLQRIREDFRFG